MPFACFHNQLSQPKLEHDVSWDMQERWKTIKIRIIWFLTIFAKVKKDNLSWFQIHASCHYKHSPWRRGGNLGAWFHCIVFSYCHGFSNPNAACHLVLQLLRIPLNPSKPGVLRRLPLLLLLPLLLILLSVPVNVLVLVLTLALALIVSLSTSTNYYYYYTFYNGHNTNYYYLRCADGGRWFHNFIHWLQ